MKNTFCALLLTTMSSVAFADLPSDEGLNAKQQLMSTIGLSSCLAADFEQIMYDERGEVLQNATGQAFAAKPRLMHWSVQSPDLQQIITDGTTLWRYEADLEQVIISDLSLSGGGLPLDVLTGDPSALDLYDVSFNEDAFDLVPVAEDAFFSGIRLQFNSDYQISAIQLRDNFLQLTEISFAHTGSDCSQESLYQFLPPKGIDVIYE